MHLTEDSDLTAPAAVAATACERVYACVNVCVCVCERVSRQVRQELLNEGE